ncbi:polysaccharide deacetylase family protein [Clostridium sp.]|uniref:polysaccharide deacetylase family protein n=1 Tax=Clostridium sp. TaxID=1506 RepID=UPI002FC96C7A
MRLGKRNKRRFTKSQKRKYTLIGFIIIALFLAFSYVGVKTYAFMKAPRVEAPKIEKITAEKEEKVDKPNVTKKSNVSVSFQDGNPLENADAIKVTDSEALPKRTPSKEKVVYLTFDDGPTSSVTPAVLDVLKQHDVKATFFVLGKMCEKYPDILKRTYNEGHLIANHSYSHDYNLIYSTTDNFISDMKRAETVIQNTLGITDKIEVIRFPGGSFGQKKEPFRKAAAKNGYYYIDWNSLNGDSEGSKKNEEQLVQEVINTSKGKNEVVVLMHDSATKTGTANSLSNVIEHFKSQGYKFDTLNNYY